MKKTVVIILVFVFAVTMISYAAASGTGLMLRQTAPTATAPAATAPAPAVTAPATAAPSPVHRLHKYPRTFRPTATAEPKHAGREPPGYDAKKAERSAKEI
jgi:multidrug efflux pump subunit AcrA (membrane-fusion protein)